MILRLTRRSDTHSAFPQCAILSLLLVTIPTNATLAQPGSCEPSIKAPSLDSPYSYRLRIDRCEGIYAREVAGDTLMIASLTRQFEDFTPTAGGRLRLSWELARPLPVRLAASSLRPHFYYRMDSVRPVGTSVYDWPTDVLAALKVTKADLGVVATALLPLAGGAQDFYVPLRVGASSAAAKGGPVQLVVVSDVELSEVYVSVSLLAPDGQPLRTIRKNERLGYGDYPAERGIPINLSSLGAAGLYQVDIGATLVSGGSANLRFRFYHGGV